MGLDGGSQERNTLLLSIVTALSASGAPGTIMTVNMLFYHVTVHSLPSNVVSSIGADAGPSPTLVLAATEMLKLGRPVR